MSFVDHFWQLPVLARTITAAVVVVSIGVRLGVIPFTYVFHHPHYLWQSWTSVPQLWRPITCYLVASSGLGLLFDPYFLYQYTVQLETGNPRFPRKVDLVWYMIFVCSTVLVTNYLLGFAYFTFLPALIIALVYTATQDQRGAKTQFFFFQIPAQLLPYCMIFINLLVPGGSEKIPLELEGLFAAHLFDFFHRIWPEFGNGPRLLSTPAWLERIYPTPRETKKNYGTSIRPDGGAAAGKSSGFSFGSTGGPSDQSWRSRGPGRRLG